MVWRFPFHSSSAYNWFALSVKWVASKNKCWLGLLHNLYSSPFLPPQLKYPLNGPLPQHATFPSFKPLPKTHQISVTHPTQTLNNIII